jgi:hypothetical protein
MKYLLTLSFAVSVFIAAGQEPDGAWVHEEDGTREVMIITDGYFSISTFKKNEFIETQGGLAEKSDGALHLTFEFHTQQAELVGTEYDMEYQLKGDQLEADFVSWKRLDKGGPGKLAGAWLISGRERDGEIVMMDNSGPRNTMKILSGTRFQWIAYNTETREFLGTGGGTYTTRDGKYTENIDFFSRDNSRAGASLEFDYEIKDGNWHHKGLSSKGQPIYEVWSKRK